MDGVNALNESSQRTCTWLIPTTTSAIHKWLCSKASSGNSRKGCERDRRSAREVQDRGDEANTDQWREANAAMIDHHVDEISGIQAALSRVQSGTYGLCVDCGEAIGFQRLQAYPSANRCVQCQSKAESA